MESEKKIQLLCVRLGKFWLGIDVSRTVEILRAEPSAKEAISFRGSDIPLVNLDDILSIDTSSHRGPRRVVVSEAGEKLVGLIIDSAEEIIRTDAANMRRATGAKVELNRDVLDGILELDDREIYVISPEKICRLARVK